ncbi:MAG: lauroyl acyltransferase [Kiloniellales bacterium]
MKRLRYLIEALALRVAFVLLGLLPVDTASNLGGFLGRNIGPRLPASARARRNLRLVFPENSAAETERIVAGMWDNLGRVAAEYPHIGEITAPESGRIDWIDTAPVRAMRDDGCAGILVSAHLANWEVMPAAAIQRGVDMTIIVREPNNPLVRPLIERARGVAGGVRAPKGLPGAKAAVGALRRGRVLGLLYDQKLNDGISVPFFGIEAMTPAAPAQLALRFGCPLVPVRVERVGPARFRLASFDALALPQSGDRQADTVAVMTTLNEILEAWIRDRPEQWLWLHRRWPEAAYRQAESGVAKPGD